MSDLNVLNANINQIANEVTSIKETQINNFNQAGTKWLDGLTSTTKNISESLDNIDQNIDSTFGDVGWFKDMFDELMGSVNAIEKNYKNNQRDAVNLRNSINQRSDINSINKSLPNIFKDLSNKTDKIKNIKINDLKKIPFGLGTAFALIHEDLMLFRKDLDKREKKDKGNFSNFFKGLIAGAVGIGLLALSLVAFAGAMNLFTNVEWKKALTGLLSFSLFIISSIFIAKLASINLKTFKNFAIASFALSGALLTFSIALLITSSIASFKDTEFTLLGKTFKIPAINLIAALGALTVFTIFISKMGVIAQLMTQNSGNFKDFAKGSLFISTSLITFSIALYISSAIISGDALNIFNVKMPPIKWKSALQATGLFIVFIETMAIASNIAGENQKHFEKFAKASIIMSLSLVAFSAALYISGKLISKGAAGSISIGGLNINVPDVDILTSITGLGLFFTFITAFTGVAILASKFAPNILKFTTVSLLMSASLLTFSIALGISTAIFNGQAINIGGFSLPEIDVISAIKTLGLFSGFILAFTLIGVLGTKAMPFIAIFTGITFLMSLSLVAFAGALSVTVLAMQGGNIDILGKKFDLGEKDPGRFKSAMAGLGAMSLFFVAFAALSVPATLASIGVAITTKAMISISKATIPMALAMTLVSALGTGKEVSFNYESKEYHLLATNQENWQKGLDFIKIFIQNFGKTITFFDNESKKSKKSAASIKPLLEVTDLMVNVIIKASSKLNEAPKIDVTMFTPIFSIVNALVDVSNKMSTESSSIYSEVSKSITPIIESFDNIINVIDKIANLKTKKGTSLENATSIAVMNLTIISDNMFNANGPIIKVLSSLKKISIKSEQTFTVIPSIINSMANIAELINHLSNFKDKNNNEINLEKSIFIIDRIGSIIEINIGNLITKLGKLKDNNISQVEKIVSDNGILQNIIKSIALITSTMAQVDESGIYKLENFKLSDDFIYSTQTFLRGVENLAGGITILSNKNNNIEAISNSMIKLSGVSISRPLSELEQLGNQANQLRNVADALRDISNETKRINDSVGKNSIINAMSSVSNTVLNAKNAIFNKLSGSDGNDMSSTIGVRNAQIQTQKIPDYSKEIGQILMYMERWEMDGILTRTSNFIDRFRNKKIDQNRVEEIVKGKTTSKKK